MTDIHETTRPIYGPGSSHNYIADLLMRSQGGSEGDEARARLAGAAALEAERRNAANLAISQSHGGSDFGGPSAAAHFNAAFTDQATKAVTIAPLFERRELPQGAGETYKVPTVTTSVTPSEQADDATVATQASPVTAAVSVPVGTISALLTVSRQWIDLVLAPGGEAIAAEILGRRYAEALDTALYSGSGSSGQTIGLRSTTSPTTGTYTDASPTVQKIAQAVLKLRSNVFKTRGAAPDVAITHPSIGSFVYAGDALTTGGLSIAPPFDKAGLRLVEYAGVPTNLGAGTNQAEVVLARTADLWYAASAPVIDVADDYSGITNGQLAIAVHGYVASPAGNLNPAGVGVLSGTGLIVQSGY